MPDAGARTGSCERLTNDVDVVLVQRPPHSGEADAKLKGVAAQQPFRRGDGDAVPAVRDHSSAVATSK